MLVMSQNALNYGIPVPDDAIYRINLAWINNIEELSDEEKRATRYVK